MAAADDKKLPHGIARGGGARAALIELRGPSGRLYGYLDPATQTIVVKRKGERAERIDLAALLLTR